MSQIVLQGILTFMFGQWKLLIDSRKQEYRFENPHPDDPGWLRWFSVKMGKYNAPVIDPEPTLAFDMPGAQPSYVGYDGKTLYEFSFERVPMVSGIICHGGHRGSLTNLKLSDKAVEPNDDGSVSVDGEKWWPAILFHKDAMRFTPYKFDVIMTRVRPTVVQVLELGDLPHILCP